jgi:uncharacterized protein Yka (UPF0111/DUF47 family)
MKSITITLNTSNSIKLLEEVTSDIETILNQIEEFNSKYEFAQFVGSIEMDKDLLKRQLIRSMFVKGGRIDLEKNCCER